MLSVLNDCQANDMLTLFRGTSTRNIQVQYVHYFNVLPFPEPRSTLNINVRK